MYTIRFHRKKLNVLHKVIRRWFNAPKISIFLAVILTGCSLQPDYIAPASTPPDQWSPANKPQIGAPVSAPAWWAELHDPAIDQFVESSFTHNPTLDKALARIDEARGQIGFNRADYFPTVTASGNISEDNTRINGGNGGANSSVGATRAIIGDSRTSTIGPSLSWELDLWGRVRSSVEASERRLDARTADAESTKLSLAVQVANTVIDWRACAHAVEVDRKEIISRQKTLDLLEKKTRAGFTAEVDTARVSRDLAAAQGALATQQELCTRDVNALVQLTGIDRDAVLAVLAKPLPTSDPADTTATFMPVPPSATPQLPATVLLTHPSIVAADRDAAAAWADTGVARAEQLPKIDLTAALTYQWIRAAGSTLSLATWSLGPKFAATIFSAGKESSYVDTYKARYAQAAATLQETVRSTVKEVENALAAEQSAGARMEASQRSVTAAKVAFMATQAQWDMGMASLLELEDARRQYAAAQDNVITAARDRALAWVSLVNATANSITLTPSITYEPDPLPQ